MVNSTANGAPSPRHAACHRVDHGHLHATGRDARGRKQYRYHALWQQQRGDDKFEAMRAFGAALPRIRRRVQRELAGHSVHRPTRSLVLATLVRRLDTTFIRIGNEAYARGNGSYGLTTLRTRHAGVRDARLSFKGKSGVRHEVTLSDRRVATVVRGCQALPGHELFQYVGDDGDVHKLTSSDVNDDLSRIAGVHVTAKDFRTWHGSVLALEFTRLACAGEPVPAPPRPWAPADRSARERYLPDARQPPGCQRFASQGPPCKRSRIS